MEIEVQRAFDKLIPTDKHQAEMFLNIPEYKPFIIKYTDKRNLGNHRRFFAFLGTAFDMQEHYQTKEALRFALIVKAGHVERIESHKGGKIVLMPKSMAFDKMKEEEFKVMFKNVITAFHSMLQEMGRDITEADLMRLIDFD